MAVGDRRFVNYAELARGIRPVWLCDDFDRIVTHGETILISATLRLVGATDRKRKWARFRRLKINDSGRDDPPEKIPNKTAEFRETRTLPRAPLSLCLSRPKLFRGNSWFTTKFSPDPVTRTAPRRARQAIYPYAEKIKKASEKCRKSVDHFHGFMNP